MTDIVIRKTEYGEVGIDDQASPGNGKYYAKSYIVDYDVCGFNSEEEAMDELEFITSMARLGGI